MSNQVASKQTTNIVPVQGVFGPEPTFTLQYLVGPAGTPFTPPINPIQSGLTITDSTIDSSVIGGTNPAAAYFTMAQVLMIPLSDYDVANKLYVDSVAQGLDLKASCLYTTTNNIVLSGLGTQAGGDWPSSLTIGDRILVKNQTNQAQNGIYTASVGAWSRTPDLDNWVEVPGAFTFIESGSVYLNTGWVCIAPSTGTIGMTAMPWSQFSGAGTYSAGTGLSLVGNTFSISNTGVTAASYGGASQTLTATVNAQGQLTALSATSIAISANQITGGTIDSARILGSYTGITGVGTLSDLSVTNTINGSINGNAATATTANSATTANTSINLSGGSTGALPYQSAAGATAMLSPGTNGQVLTLSSGIPSWATPTVGTVTSVSGTGTVSGISLSGTVTSSGSLTLGGSLDLSAPPTIGGTTPNTITGTTITATTKFVGPYYDAANSGGGALRNASGTAQLSWGSGGGDNLSLQVSTNMNGANAQIDISPTGTGHVHIKPTGAGSVEITPANLGVINNMSIGGTTAAAAKFTTIDFSGTLSVSGAAGTSGQILQSNGSMSAPSWVTPVAYATVTDDTTTNATYYPLFANQTAGNLTTEYTSSTKLQYNPSTGVFTATGFSGSGASLTSLSAGQLSGTIPSDVLGNSSLFVGTTSITLNRASASQTLTGVSIDGSAGSATTATTATNANNIAITDNTSSSATWYPVISANSTGNNPATTSSTKLSYVPNTGVLSATSFTGAGTGLTGTASSLSIGGNAATATTATTANSVANSITFNASGGAAAGSSYNGSAARTIDYSTVGAPSASGSGASGTWNISINGNAATATSATSASSATNATNSTNILIAEDTTTNADYFPVWVTSNTGNLPPRVTSTKLKFNPSTGFLTTTGGVGGGNF